MRRISLALALLGAVAAAGCGGAGGKSPAPSSGNKGIEQSPMKLVVRGEGAFFDPVAGTTIILPKGGVITSTPAGINCGANGATLNKVCEFSFAYGTAVTLTATPNTAGWVYGWAGACTGTAGCSFTMDDTQFVGVRFAADSGSLGAHGPFTAPEIHAAEYLKLQQGVAGAYDCTACHGGAALTGLGLAPSCASCHSWPLGKHFLASGHNSGVCARCHAGDGFRDFIGVDGSSSVLTLGYGASADPATTSTMACSTTVTTNCFNSGMKCDMCHNPATALGGGSLSQHKFPSGNIVTMDGDTAICSQCHDGGRPGYEVSQLMAQAPATIPTTALDSPTTLTGSNNKTVRAHYLPAASTLFGTAAANWYQYPGAVYTTQNLHGNLGACTSCHNAHTGELPPDSNVVEPDNTIQKKCGPCHANEAGAAVANFLELEETRQFGFEGDIDGNVTQESLKLEIGGLGAKLYAAIQAYAKDVAGTQGCYYNNRFYILSDGAVACGTAPNNVEYNTKYTPRLLRAVYNYMLYQNDVGAWAHNPRYAIEIIYDSIADLNLGLTWAGKATVPNGKRAFNGHFGAADAASPYSAMLYHGGSNAVTGELIPPMGGWSAACGQCHGGAAGLTSYLAGMPAALTVATPAVSAMQCNTCHTYNGTDMKGLRTISKVYFPPQKNGAATAGEVSFDAANLPVTFALCGSCHSARENKKTVDNKNLVAGTFSATLVNPHYLGAAATVMGTRTKSWYEYDGKAYTAFPAFWKSGTNGRAPGPHGSPHGAECTGCHQGKDSRHSFEVNLSYCAGCHTGPYALAPKEEEYASMKTELLGALNSYVTANLTAFQTANGADATGLCYNGNVYGYVLINKATGCSGTAAKLDLASMKAAYNLHWMNKDPGGWAHNEYYVMQLVYDSITDLGFTPSFVVTASSTDATLNRP